MGLEVGWHLRFASHDVIVAWVQNSAVGQVRYALLPEMPYDMDVEEMGSHTVVTLTKRKT